MRLHAITMQKAGLCIENNKLTSYNKHYRKLHQKKSCKVRNRLFHTLQLFSFIFFGSTSNVGVQNPHE